MKEPKDEGEKHENIERRQGDGNLWKISETDHRTTEISTSDGRRPDNVHDELETTSDFGNNTEVLAFLVTFLLNIFTTFLRN